MGGAGYEGGGGAGYEGGGGYNLKFLKKIDQSIFS